MIQISGGAMRFGARTLFEGLDWLVGPQDRMGIVGANGSGKTTLLKILADIEHLDKGTVTRQKGLKLGYLPQDGLTLAGRSLFDECLSVFDEAIALEKEQEDLAHKMSELDHESPEYEAVTDRFQWVIDRYQALDGYTKEAQVGTVLDGLAFPKKDWDRRIEEFSGGWQMRIALAKLLLAKPNLLLLDEPTNHLDLEARNWLEDYLGGYPFAFIVISHDRYFLDVTVKKIIEVWNKKVHFYTGNYEKYQTLKQERLEQIRATRKNQQDRIHHLETFINRFRYQATKAAQVQSRVKELEKIERVEVPEEERTIHFRFPQPSPSGRVVAEFHGVAKSYGSLEVFRDVDLTVERGDRIALVGENGAGKSTLIRMLAGEEPLTEGQQASGHKVEIDYFAQDQYKVLDPDARILDDLTRLVPRANDSELRGLLGCFLFSGDDAYKPIGVLSGGERNRYALARVLVKPSNFLLLDEPTNHLDMRAKDVLLTALLDFTGTVAFVSHDRYFLDKLATKVFAVGDGKVVVYPGNYEDYLWQAGRADGGGDRPTKAGVSDSLKAALQFSNDGQARENGSTSAQAPKRRINPIQAKKLRKRVAGLEDEISRLEHEISELEKRMVRDAGDHQKSSEILTQMEALRVTTADREQEWTQLTEKLETEG
jgi:ATP-binding cassette subfamily F protein 3